MSCNLSSRTHFNDSFIIHQLVLLFVCHLLKLIAMIMIYFINPNDFLFDFLLLILFFSYHFLRVLLFRLCVHTHPLTNTNTNNIIIIIIITPKNRNTKHMLIVISDTSFESGLSEDYAIPPDAQSQADSTYMDATIPSILMRSSYVDSPNKKMECLEKVNLKDSENC